MTTTRRDLLGLGLMALAGALTTACSAGTPTPAPTTASTPPAALPPTKAAAATPTSAAVATTTPVAQSSALSQSVTLVWWMNDGPPLGNRMDPVMKEFMQERPQIKVQIIDIPGDLAQKLAPAGIAGTLPDVYYARTFTTADYAIRQWLVDLTDYVNRDAKEVNVDDFFDVETVKEMWKGRWYTQPENFSDMVVYYNKDIFDKSNVPYPKDTWTWDDFLETAKRLTKTDSSGKPVQWGAGLGYYGNWVMWGYLKGNGGEILSDDLRTCVINSEVNAATIQFFADLLNVHKVTPAPNVLPKGFDPFINGAMAMTINGSWLIPALRDGIRDKFAWDVAAIPLGKTGKYPINVEGGAYGIGSAKQKDPAWEALKYGTSTRGIEVAIDEQLVTMPGRKSAQPEWIKVATSGKQPPAHATVFFDIMKNVPAAVPSLPYYTEFSRLFDNAVAGVMSGEHKAAEILPKLQEDANKVIAQTKF